MSRIYHLRKLRPTKTFDTRIEHKKVGWCTSNRAQQVGEWGATESHDAARSHLMVAGWPLFLHVGWTGGQETDAACFPHLRISEMFSGLDPPSGPRSAMEGDANDPLALWCSYWEAELQNTSQSSINPWLPNDQQTIENRLRFLAKILINHQSSVMGWKCVGVWQFTYSNLW